jgi:hypothetical protein
MTIKEKALELVNKFLAMGLMHTVAIKCAAIVVDEILNAIPKRAGEYVNPDIRIWRKVKSELKKL